MQEEHRNPFGDENLQLVKHFSEGQKDIRNNLKNIQRDDNNMAHKSFQHRREKFKKMDHKLTHSK